MLFVLILFALFPICASAQENRPGFDATSQASTAASQSAADHQMDPSKQVQTSPAAPSTEAASKEVSPEKQQPKRIMGIIPNYPAVSAGAKPPPPTPRQSFKLATETSFDYSSFILTGLTSMMAEGINAHPELGKGVGGFGRYYWRGVVDKTDSNYWVLFILPTVLHHDERYYTLGHGSIWKRGIYAGSRVFITPNYAGTNTFNGSEVFGRAIAQGISNAYYPAPDRTAGDNAKRYGYALGRDALVNVFREFWPDIARHLFHHKP